MIRILILCLLAVLTARRVPVWGGDVPLWSDAIVHAPCSIRAHQQLALAALRTNDSSLYRREWGEMTRLIVAKKQGAKC